MKTSVLIADDHRLVRETWNLIISSEKDYFVVAACSSATEAVEAAKRYQPDIVLMDINFPGMNGIEATRQIRKEAAGCRVIGVSAHTHTAYVRKMIQEGAMGYVTKSSSRNELFAAMQQVLKNRRYLCEETMNLLAGQAIDDQKTGIHALTQREREIILLLRQGHSSKEIAEEFHISIKTVEVHRHNILKKLGLKNTAALINYMHSQVFV